MANGLSRRDVMIASAGVAGLAGCSTLADHPDPNSARVNSSFDDPFTPDTLHRDLEYYDGLGIHRSGSQADIDTVDWMETLWRDLGYHTERQGFEVPDYDARDAFLALSDGRSIALSAQPPFKTSSVAQGRLHYLNSAMAGSVDADLNGRIIVAETDYSRHSEFEGRKIHPFLALADRFDLAALILIANGPSGETAFLNMNPDHDYPLTSLASPSGSEELIAAALAQQTASLTTPGPAAPRRAENLIGHISRPGPHIVISTPISGWTHCAAERGPGVATMRALARWLPDACPNHSITLFCASGHELDALGGRLWLEAGAPPVDDTALWVHLGAGWAARDWHETPMGLLPLQQCDPQRYLMASPNILSAVQPAFSDLAGLASTYPLTVDTAAGELKHIAAHGYERLFGAFGAHRLHHVMSDRMNAVSGDLLARPAQAFRNAIRNVIQTA